MCVADLIREKYTKTLYFESSWSFKVIDVNTHKNLSPVLVMISSMFVPICNRFHASRTNNGKIKIF